MGFSLTPRLIGVTIGSLALAGSALALPASAATRHKVLRDGYTPPALPAAPVPAPATTAPTSTSTTSTTVARSTTTSTTVPAPVSSVPSPSVLGEAASGLSSTIGSVGLPQVVRVGDSLREVDPAHPGSLLAGDYRFVGTDAYELNTDWSVNYGCGPDVTDAQMGQMMDSLGAGSVMRVWFFEQFAINKYSGAIDWTALDRTVATAAAHGVRLIATLGNQEGTCDDNLWKNPSWYAGGYADQVAGEPLSYQQWVAAVTARYRNSPAILAWEPVNEPRPDTCTSGDCWTTATCPDSDAARSDLRSFFDAIGSEIRATDPNHLISDGAPAVEGCGVLTFADLAYVDASPGIDLASFHDYSGGTPLSATTMSQWSGLSSTDDKPVFAGENGGLLAAPAPFAGQSCPSVAARAATYQTKITGELTGISGMVGWLFWDDMPSTSTPAAQPTCEYATWPGDPLSAVLQADQAGLTVGSR